MRSDAFRGPTCCLAIPFAAPALSPGRQLEVRILDEADGVAEGIAHGGHQDAAADLMDRLDRGGAPLEEQVPRRACALDAPVGEPSRAAGLRAPPAPE